MPGVVSRTNHKRKNSVLEAFQEFLCLENYQLCFDMSWIVVSMAPVYHGCMVYNAHNCHAAYTSTCAFVAITKFQFTYLVIKAGRIDHPDSLGLLSVVLCPQSPVKSFYGGYVESQDLNRKGT